MPVVRRLTTPARRLTVPCPLLPARTALGIDAEADALLTEFGQTAGSG